MAMEHFSYWMAADDFYYYDGKGIYKMPKSPADLLQESVNTFKQRGEVYGNDYERFGRIMKAVFPGGFYFNDAASDVTITWTRMNYLIMIVNKIARYAENFDKGGHDDSLNDISVYAAMLRHIDQEIAEIPF
jgi:hypothetical protein